MFMAIGGGITIVQSCGRQFGITNLSHERVRGYSKKPSLGIHSRGRIPQNEKLIFMQMLL